VYQIYVKPDKSEEITFTKFVRNQTNEEKLVSNCAGCIFQNSDGNCSRSVICPLDTNRVYSTEPENEGNEMTSVNKIAVTLQLDVDLVNRYTAAHRSRDAAIKDLTTSIEKGLSLLEKPFKVKNAEFIIKWMQGIPLEYKYTDSAQWTSIPTDATGIAFFDRTCKFREKPKSKYARMYFDGEEYQVCVFTEDEIFPKLNWIGQAVKLES
jgi:hypothetical protein